MKLTWKIIAASEHFKQLQRMAEESRGRKDSHMKGEVARRLAQGCKFWSHSGCSGKRWVCPTVLERCL